MNAFVLHAHPEPRSFCSALKNTTCDALRAAGHHVEVSDLYAMGFDPVSDRRNFDSIKDPDYFKQQIEEMHATECGGFRADVEREIRRVENCDLMIWTFPLWWFGLPAIMKGWVDRVFAMGRTYGGGRFYDTGVFRGKRAMLCLTTGGPAPAYAPEGFNGDINAILRPIQRGMLQFTGFDVLAPHIAFGPAHISQEERSAELARFASRVGGLPGESPIDVGHY